MPLEGAGIQLHGTREFKVLMAAAPGIVQSAVGAELKKATYETENLARKRVPVITSRLQGSIKATYNALTMKGVVGSDVKYACIFDAHSRINTKNGLKTIGQIKEGDYVLTQNGNFHKVLNKTKFSAMLKPNLVRIIFKWRRGRNRYFIVTADHKILINRDSCNMWCKAIDLKETDLLFTPIKKAYNKGSGNKNKNKCLKCGKLTKNKCFCNMSCRDLMWKDNHPSTGSKRTRETRQLMREKRQELHRKNPEMHPNVLSAKRGKISNNEKAVMDWLQINGFDFEQQMKVDKYWHKDQAKDILRDRQIKKILPDWKIIHLRFVNKKEADVIDNNPLPNVFYIQCNNSMNSFVDETIFKKGKILSIEKVQYEFKGGGIAFLYDLSIENIHSFVCNGALVSNSNIEYGPNNEYGPEDNIPGSRTGFKPYLRPSLAQAIKGINTNISKALNKTPL